MTMDIDPADTPKIIEVASGLFVRQEIDNLTWADMGDYVLVVDALEKAETEGEVFAAIEETTGGKPVRYVLNTHTHYDHVVLNDSFRRRWGAEIINQVAIPMPAEGRQFEGSRRRAVILPMPNCHTDEDCVVWFPDDKVLAVGDIFGWGLIPLTTALRPQTAELLLTTYQRLIDFGAVTVIPGHGPLCTTAELRRWMEYFNWLHNRCRDACAEGRSEQDILKELSAPPSDMLHWWRFAKWKHADSVSKMLSAVRRGRL